MCVCVCVSSDVQANGSAAVMEMSEPETGTFFFSFHPVDQKKNHKILFNIFTGNIKTCQKPSYYISHDA